MSLLAIEYFQNRVSGVLDDMRRFGVRTRHFSQVYQRLLSNHRNFMFLNPELGWQAHTFHRELYANMRIASQLEGYWKSNERLRLFLGWTDDRP